MESKPSKQILQHPLQFIISVLQGFRANQGFLLASAVAFNTLLSVIPMFAIILVGLSQFIDAQELLDLAGNFLEIIAPGQSPSLLAHLELFIADWQVVGVAGFVMLVFFSALAFTVLENAMSVIFHHRVRIQRRHFAISAVIPYVYILFLGAGLLMVSIVSTMLHSFDDITIRLFGRLFTLDTPTRVILYLAGLTGEIFLLTSLYLVMPVGRIKLRHALLGGVTTALLWEVMRRVLAWYFTHLSYISVIYGSFATSIVILISFEMASVILLLGAQTIAEYERLRQRRATQAAFETGTS